MKAMRVVKSSLSGSGVVPRTERRPSSGAFQTAEEPHESGFARAVRSHQRNEPEASAPLLFEADAVHRMDRTGSVEGVGESLDNALKMDRWG